MCVCVCVCECLEQKRVRFREHYINIQSINGNLHDQIDHKEFRNRKIKNYLLFKISRSIFWGNRNLSQGSVE